MCLNKLYADITVLVGTEFPLPRFFVAVDTVCRGWLAKYPPKLLCAGEYTPSASLADVLPLADCLYPALLDTGAGRLTGDTATAARGADEAESAYLALWRAAARGKKKRGDQW